MEIKNRKLISQYQVARVLKRAEKYPEQLTDKEKELLVRIYALMEEQKKQEEKTEEE